MLYPSRWENVPFPTTIRGKTMSTADTKPSKWFYVNMDSIEYARPDTTWVTYEDPDTLTAKAETASYEPGNRGVHIQSGLNLHGPFASGEEALSYLTSNPYLLAIVNYDYDEIKEKKVALLHHLSKILPKSCTD
jgi:hypothetical protein